MSFEFPKRDESHRRANLKGDPHTHTHTGDQTALCIICYLSPSAGVISMGRILISFADGMGIFIGTRKEKKKMVGQLWSNGMSQDRLGCRRGDKDTAWC